MKTILTLLFLLQSLLLFAQSETLEKPKSVGIHYFGELGFRPGLEVDFGLPILKNKIKRAEKKRLLFLQGYLRPSFAYYHYAHFSNNFLLGLKFNYQFKLVNSENYKYLFAEPYLKIGYLRYAFIGEIFDTANGGFEERNFGGANSIVLGAGLDFGGKITNRFDWLVGFEYLAESTDDKLLLHRFVFKLGTRIKLQTK